jgi:Zn-dependent protease
MLGKDGVVRLGCAYGIPVELHLGFFFSAAILTFPLWRTFRTRDIALAAIVIAILFVSVLMHEFAHAVAARKFQIRTALIEINMYGGLAHLERWAGTTGQDCTIGFAGPLSNLLLGLVGLAALQLLPADPGRTVEIGQILRDVPGPAGLMVRSLQALTYINIGLFVVNLLPGFPLDGGRILYFLAADRWNSRTAKRIVGSLGVAFAVLSTVFLVGTALSGFPIWAPPEFRPNWDAVQDPEHAPV